MVVFEPSESISGGIPEIEVDDFEDMFLGAEIKHLFEEELFPYELR